MTYLCFTCVYVWRYTCMYMLICIRVKSVQVTTLHAHTLSHVHIHLGGGVSEGERGSEGWYMLPLLWPSPQTTRVLQHE